MSLVTNPKHIIIEDDDLWNESSDARSSNEEERLYQALRGIRSEDAHRVGSDRATEEGRPHRTHTGQQKKEKQKGPQHQQQQARKPVKKPRRSDPKAMERLTTPTAASRARSQRKYVDQLKEAKREEKRASSAPRAISPVATKAGMRLYAAAVGQQRQLDRLRAEHEKVMKQKEEKPTFKPQITSLAKCLGETGYAAPHERYDKTKEKMAKSFLLRERERMDRITAGCTFQPTLTAASEKMAEMRRKSEPFHDAGERLFFEGGHRLIRQQLRERILEQRADNRVIGGFQISPGAAKELAARLLKWQEICDRNHEAAKEEYVRSATQPLTPKPQLAERYRRQDHPNLRDGHSQKRQQPSSSTYNLSERPPLDELRLMRLRALFFKYAPSEKSTSLQLQDVKRQVRELFPGDSGVVAALAADFNDMDAISRSAFVDSLLRFEQRYGPQPWGHPTGEHVRSAFGESPIYSQPEGATTPQPLRRANSARAISSRNKDTLMQNGAEGVEAPASPCHLPYRLASSSSSSSRVCGRLKRDTTTDSKHREPRSQREKAKTVVTRQSVSRSPSQLSALDKEQCLLEQHEAELLRRQRELLAKTNNTMLKAPPPPPPPPLVSSSRKSQERLPSPGSVELSSFTEDCGSTPNAKWPEEIVAELEALVETPVERSATASPKRPNARALDARKKGRGAAGTSIPSSLRRGVNNVPAPGGARTLDDRVAQRRLIKEIEEILGGEPGRYVCASLVYPTLMGDPFVRPGLTYQPHIEQVLLRNEGTLTLESSKDDWLRYQHRDTLASFILHRDRLEYLSLVENVAPARMERILLERAVDPTRKRERSNT